MNKVVHFELPAENMQRVESFYHSVFGWKFFHVQDLNYHMVHTQQTDEKGMPKEVGAINGGFYKKTSSEDAPVIVIEVPSIDLYAKKIEKAGGKVVMPKQQVGEMGLYMKVKDPEGNIIGLWQVLSHRN